MLEEEVKKVNPVTPSFPILKLDEVHLEDA